MQFTRPLPIQRIVRQRAESICCCDFETIRNDTSTVFIQKKRNTSICINK